MNEYKKRVLKRNITAFLLACGIILLIVWGILLIMLIGHLLGDYLPYALTALIVISFTFVLSLPIRDILKDKENAREYQRQKDEERKRNGWKSN